MDVLRTEQGAHCSICFHERNNDAFDRNTIPAEVVWQVFTEWIEVEPEGELRNPESKWKEEMVLRTKQNEEME